MPDYKKQHFVPQFYLRLFSDDDEHINLYNLDRELRVEGTDIAGQCYKNYFYGKDGIEQKLSEFEGLSAQLFRAVLELKEDGALPLDHRPLVPLTMMVMSHRTLSFHDRLRRSFGMLVEELRREALEEAFEKALDSMPDQEPAASVVQAIAMAPTISDLEYAIVEFTGDRELFTCDNPVVKLNPFLIDDPIAGSKTGCYAKGLLIYLPVSPRRAVFLYDRSVYKFGTRRSGALVIGSEADVSILNRATYSSAHKNVYYYSDRLSVLQAVSKPRRPRMPVEVEKITIVKSGAEMNHGDGFRMSDIDVRLEGDLSFLSIRKDAKRDKRERFSMRRTVLWPRDESRIKRLESLYSEAPIVDPLRVIQMLFDADA